MSSSITFPRTFLPKYCQTNPNTVELVNFCTTNNLYNLNRLCKYIIEASKLIYYS